MSIKELLDAIKTYGIGGVVFAVIIWLAYLIIKSNWFSDKMSKIGDKIISIVVKEEKRENSMKTINESDIINHDIFNYIDFWMYSKIPTFRFSTDYRTIVFRRYLTIFLRKYKENIRKYVNLKEFEKMDDSQLWTSLLSLINDIIYDYEKEMESSGIPKVVIEKMKIKNNDTISLIIDLIQSICDSPFYSSEKNFLKIYSILNIILSILENTITNSLHICDSINGSLKGLTISENDKTWTEP